jgi:anti-sigma-K factor RskA
MFKFRVLSAVVACFAIAAATTGIHASGHGRTLVVTMTNDQNANQIRVYDAESHALLQTLSTKESNSTTADSWQRSTTDQATLRCSGETGTC